MTIEIEKRHLYRGPITAIASTSFCQEQYILWGTGGLLCWTKRGRFDFKDHSSKALLLFKFHIIHTIRISSIDPSIILVFGERSLSVCRIAPACENITALAIVEELHDFILDSHIISLKEDRFEIILGYAHNYFDIVHLGIGSNRVTPKFRCYCPEKFVQFALSFFIPSSISSHPIDRIIVASGSVFGKIILWAPKDGVVGEETTEGCVESIGDVLGTIHRHEGVIFKLVWGRYCNKLITVSDDRTVRLWSVNTQNWTITQIFEGWGHISRPWDAVFTNPTETEVASCAEDGTIRLWNSIGECKTCMQGHIGSVWALTIIESLDYIATGGNDASVKFWNLSQHSITSPLEEISTAIKRLLVIGDSKNQLQQTESISVPECNLEENITSIKSGGNRRRNGVNSISISPDCATVYIVLIEGSVYKSSFVNMETFSEWQLLFDTMIPVISANIHHNGNDSVDILVSSLDSSCRYFIIEGSDSKAPKAILYAWKAHPHKTVNMWIDDNRCYILTASIGGNCSLWKIAGPDSSELSSDYKATDTELVDIRLDILLALQTPRKEIASACLFHHVGEEKYVVLGDSRGNIIIYCISQYKSRSGELAEPLLFFPSIHSKDPVSCLLAVSDGGFISLGHDNTMSFFASFSVKSGDSSVVTFQRANAISTLPVHTPTQALLVENGDETSLYVCGYHGSSYIVYDIRRGYQMMRIEGGGWKRPHFCRLKLESRSGETSNKRPEILFACPAPVGKAETELQLFGWQKSSTSDSSEKELWPTQIHASTFAKVCNCSVLISVPDYTEPSEGANSSMLVVGGEDCTIKVFSFPYLNLMQETTLAKSSSLRSLASCACPDAEYRGIVLGGGGKLQYYIWIYDCSTSALLAPLRKVRVGTTWPKATQDHRILSVSCAYVSKLSNGWDSFLLLITDSRGYVTIVEYKINFLCVGHVVEDSFVVVSQSELSQCPILSSSLSSLTKLGDSYSVILASMGDTKGSVITVGVPVFDQNICKPVFLSEMNAHEMGTNAIKLSPLSCNSSSCNPSLEYVIISAGDDEGVTILYGLFEMSKDDNLHTLAIKSYTKEICRHRCAAHAAFKGVDVLEASISSNDDVIEILFATVACDQVLSFWELKGSHPRLLDISSDTYAIPITMLMDLSTADVITVSSLCSVNSEIVSRQWELVWKSREVSYVSEVSCLHIARKYRSALVENSSIFNSFCVVSGEGFQVFDLVHKISK